MTELEEKDKTIEDLKQRLIRAVHITSSLRESTGIKWPSVQMEMVSDSLLSLKLIDAFIDFTGIK